MFFKSFSSLIFPHRCIGCKSWLANDSNPPQICDDCYAGLNFLKVPAHLPRLKTQFFDKAHSALAYEHAVHDWVHQYKYHRRFHLVPSMVVFLLQAGLDWQSYDAVTYVPLHWRRQIFRGFNPAHLLADTLAKKIKMPVISSLRKVKSTKAQTKIDGEERLKNVKNVFVPTKKAPQQIKEKRLLLIDDVITTGATANECARTLIHASAKAVTVLTLARPL